MRRRCGVWVGLLAWCSACYEGVDPADADAAATELVEDSTAGDGPASSGASSTATTAGSAGTSTSGNADASDSNDSSPDTMGPDSDSTGAGAEDGSDDADVDPLPQGCSPEGVEMVAIINEVRAQHQLPAIALSPSMCEVAAIHNQDLIDHAPHAPAQCNLHSWSDQGPWSACCYTSDHAQASCMWDKPKELTVYPGNGYEVSAAGGGLTPQSAVDLWMNSPGHRAVLLSEGAWANPPWKALGADIKGGFAAAWFGREDDPAP